MTTKTVLPTNVQAARTWGAGGEGYDQVSRGIADAVGYPEDPAPLAGWASRMKAAHYNAVENLVIFAAVVLILNAAGISNQTTVMACNIYFWARVVHFAAYGFAIPWVRTLSFVVGFGCQAALLLQLL